MAVVGLEKTIYHVAHGVGIVELCAVVYEPNIACPIAFPFNISLSTSDGKSCLHCLLYIHVYIFLFSLLY